MQKTNPAEDPLCHDEAMASLCAIRNADMAVSPILFGGMWGWSRKWLSQSQSQPRVKYFENCFECFQTDFNVSMFLIRFKFVSNLLFNCFISFPHLLYLLCNSICFHCCCLFFHSHLFLFLHFNFIFILS